jgi:hypothetical protein
VSEIQRSFEQFPLVKISIDRNSAMSHSYVYTRVDLPIFVKRGSLGMLKNTFMPLGQVMVELLLMKYW